MVMAKMASHERRKLVIVVGSTGVGKTACAYQLALSLNGEIISIDSRYLYRGMDIGTAKPDWQIRATVRHHLVDVADPDQSWNLAIFQEQVSMILDDIFKRGKLPILVGGTGQYYRAIVDGWQPPAVPPNDQLRTILDQVLRPLDLQLRKRFLDYLDPEAAEKIDPRNLRRLIRAIEVIYSTGFPFSRQRKGAPLPYPAYIIGLTLPREELYEKCDRRIHQMFAEGWVDEVERLLQKGYHPNLPSFSAIGYREIAAYLNGLLSMDEVISQIQRRTRTLIRRQANWFRLDDPTIHWFLACDDVSTKILSDIERWSESLTDQDGEG